MSYLSQPTSTADYGVVKIGNFVDVTDWSKSNVFIALPKYNVIIFKVPTNANAPVNPIKKRHKYP